jgi:hypothetical protein
MKLEEKDVDGYLEFALKLEMYLNEVVADYLDKTFTQKELDSKDTTCIVVLSLIRWLACFAHVLKIDRQTFINVVNISFDYAETRGDLNNLPKVPSDKTLN